MLVALAQIDMGFEEIDKAKLKVKEMVEEASKHHTELIIFPEMTLTGFTMSKLTDDSIIPYFDDLAKRYNITIIYGYIEKSNQYYFNACNITDGTTKCHYQKIHPFLRESQYYQKGDHLESYSINEFRLVPTICYDLRFPILYYKASKMGNIMINIASWPEIRDEHWLSLLKARAIENQCYMIGVNRVGNDPDHHYIGHSIVFDGWGKAYNELFEDERNIYVEINLKDYPANFTLDRRNDLYLDLLKDKID